MKVLRYDSEKRAEVLAEALVVLLSGGTVVYPTETAYALGADFFSPRAYRSVYMLKYRAGDKLLPVIVPDFRYAATLVRFPPKATELAIKHWPGPLTLVLPFLYRKQMLHHNDDYLAVRVSSHPFASSLARAFGRPLISTSANVSHHPLCYRADEVLKQFEKRRAVPDLVIDAGPLPHVKPSTIVKVDDTGLSILREGPIKLPD